jgi:hypothetical protein
LEVLIFFSSVRKVFYLEEGLWMGIMNGCAGIGRRVQVVLLGLGTGG